MNTKYGWKPDIPDQRDHRLMIEKMAIMPEKVDLSAKVSIVFDQLALGSCTANAIASAFLYEQNKQLSKPSTFIPSRLFIYYNERVMENSVKEDAGAMIRDGIKSVNQSGVCSEKSWKYDIAKFARKPTKSAYTQAMAHQSLKYARVGQTEIEMKSCLAAGLPFVFGFSVYESFESAEVARTGIVPMPASTEKCLGGHAVICMGYDNATRRFLVQNSWGTSWGDHGFFYIPYEYLTNNSLSDDFWNIGLVETV